MDNKSKYHGLCINEKSIPVFSQDWWLSTIVGEENWDVVLLEKNNEIIASLPYTSKKFIFLDISDDNYFYNQASFILIAL